MSRTKKDRPSWVRSNDPSEIREAYHRHYHYYMWSAFDEIGCTLEEPEIPYHMISYRNSLGRTIPKPCGYNLYFPHYEKARGRDVVQGWSKPLRQNMRMEAVRVAKNFNSGHFKFEDYDYFTPQHRHERTWWD